MGSPVALQPLPANEAKPARPALYQTRDGAETCARRLARHRSPSGMVAFAPYLTNVVRPVEGGQAYEFRLAHFGDWEVRELGEHEVVRRQQAGMRGAIATLMVESAAWSDRALVSRIGSVREMYEGQARLCRAQAREIQAKLGLSVAR